MLDQDRPADPKSPTNNEPDESFGDILSEYEQSHTHRTREEGKRGLEGTVVAITGESVFLDIGYKTEGTIPWRSSRPPASRPRPATRCRFPSRARPGGLYELSRIKVERPKDWSALEKAFADRRPSPAWSPPWSKAGKRGCGRACLHASVAQWPGCRRNGKAGGQEIRCRSSSSMSPMRTCGGPPRRCRRGRARPTGQALHRSQGSETVHGTVRSLTDYGAFVDIGGWMPCCTWPTSRGAASTSRPTCSSGDKVEARSSRWIPPRNAFARLKQLQPHPGTWLPRSTRWASASRAASPASRFGAFVELEKGSKAWCISPRCRGQEGAQTSDVVNPGDSVDVCAWGERARTGASRWVSNKRWAILAEAAKKFPWARWWKVR